MRSAGTMLSTSVQAERQGPSMTTRSPESRTRSNRSRNGPTCPPGLARMRTSASAGTEARAQRTMATAEVRPKIKRMPKATLILRRLTIAKPAPRFQLVFARRTLFASSRAAQRRQADAGGIEAAIDGQNLSGDVTCAVAAQEEHRLRQFLLEAVAVERDRVVIVGTDFRAV